jgi:hypothetical protein
VHVPACPKLNVALIDASLTCACVSAGARLADAGLREDGRLGCVLCGGRLNRGGAHRPCGAGRAHQSCIKAQNRHAVTTRTPITRTKRPYDTLQPTQQYKRRKQLHSAIAEASQQIGCPVDALHLQQRTTPEELLHLTTAERERTRTIPSLHIPCEQTIIKCKQLLATSHATETGTFAGGAYITDPVRFVSVLCAQSPFIAVGGDTGGGHTKLGVTYSVPTPTRDNPKKTTQHFACLLVYEGGDSWLELQDCRAEGLTSFTGDSAAFPHIWAVLGTVIRSAR